MTASDAFSEYYAELLQGTYDCVDRIVLNAFFPVGQTAGGIRTWWRFLRGDDLSLDDEHLREMAGTFSRRLQAFCAKHGIPLIEAQARDRKHELAQPYLPNDPTFPDCFSSSKATRQPRYGKSSAMGTVRSPRSAIARAGHMSDTFTFT
jgi:hypothetical protein